MLQCESSLHAVGDLDRADAARPGSPSGEPSAFANILCGLTDQRRQEAEILRLASTDTLTGLSNRASFEAELECTLSRASAGGHAAAVLLLSLGNFHEINDTLGSAAGNDVLCLAAERLRAACGDGQYLARLGAGQFGVILPRVARPASLAGSAQKLLKVLGPQLLVNDVPLRLRPRIGAAMFPDDAPGANELLRRASVALFNAREGNQTFARYQPTQDPFSIKRLTLISELNDAIASNDLELWYQPKLNLRNGGVESVEALLRWRHARFGLVPPADFIPAAESTGLIGPLTLWVLRSALQQARRWRDQGMPLNVAVNVSLHDLRDPGFHTDVVEALQRSAVPAESLTVEITESAAMRDPQRVHQALAALKRLGVRLALDDFGVGQSSLGHLRQLPVDELKLDKTFAISMPSETSLVITRAAVHLARALGLSMTAEGVENEETLATLRDMGCERAQGYHISRPLPAGEVAGWLAQRKRRERLAA